MEFSSLLDPMRLPCGGTAYWDEASGISYRCENCIAVVGSVGMPKSCKDELNKYDIVLPALGSKITWDYYEGCEK